MRLDMAALIRAVGRLRKFPPVHTFCCAAFANEKLQVRGTMAAAAAGAATARLQRQRAYLALVPATRCAKVSLRGLCHMCGGGCNAQCAKVISILQEIQKKMESSGQADEAILTLLKQLAEKAEMGEGEKAEMGEGEKVMTVVTAEKTSEMVVVVSTLRKGYELVKKYQPLFKGAIKESGGIEDLVVLGGLYEVLHDTEVPVFCLGVWGICLFVKDSKAGKLVCGKVSSVINELRDPSPVVYMVSYTVFITLIGQWLLGV